MKREYIFYVNSEDLNEIKEGGYVELNLELEADPHRHRRIKIIDESQSQNPPKSIALNAFLDILEKNKDQLSESIKSDLDKVKELLLK